MEGPLAPLPCASETQFQACEECPDVENCGTRIIMRRVRDSISEVLDRTTLADLIKDVEAGVGSESLLRRSCITSDRADGCWFASWSSTYSDAGATCLATG